MKKSIEFALLFTLVTSVALQRKTAFALEVNYGFEIAIPVCHPMTDPSHFKAPVRIFDRGDHKGIVLDRGLREWGFDRSQMKHVTEDFGPTPQGWERKVDFGGGNFLFGLATAGLNCGEIAKQPSPQVGQFYEYQHLDFPFHSDVNILEIKGKSDSAQESRVRGQVVLSQAYWSSATRPGSFLTLPSGAVTLVLSHFDPSRGRWLEDARRTDPILPTSKPAEAHLAVWAIEADIPENVEIKLNLVMRRPEMPTPGSGTLHLHDSRLWGARCFPDFANPGSCL